jgi:hypothetical protein
MSYRSPPNLPRLRRWFANPLKRSSHKRPAKRAALAVEMLEDRLVPSTFNVTTLADQSIQSGVNLANGAIKATGAVTLRSAIAAADQTSGGNTIRLMVPGTYSISLPGANSGTDATGAFAILPGGNLTIINASGGAANVNGNHLDRVFDINPAFNPASPTPAFTVTLQGFTITGGLASPGDGAPGSGGGIRDQGNASLTLNNVVVAGNIATADGGGVAMENTVSVPWTLTSNGSTFSNNHAGDAGGGIETDGTGKVLLNPGTVVTGNSCVNQGGGIWLDAIDRGSGVSSVNVVFNPNIIETQFVPIVTFTSVDGQGSGAEGIVLLNSALNIVGVKITNPGSGYDMPPSVVLSIQGDPLFVTVTDAIAHLPLQSATLTVAGATISDNQALTGPGGGIGNAGASTVLLGHSNIVGNTSGGQGGGFGDQNGQGNLLIASCLFLSNTAAGAGGGVYETGSMTGVANSEFFGNASGDAGGGLDIGGGSLTMQNCTLANNTAAGNVNSEAGGGALEIATSATGLLSSVVTNTTIDNNRALNNVTVSGGGIDAGLLTGGLFLLSDTVNGNYSTLGGGLNAPAATGSISIENTILAGNFGSTGADVNDPANLITDLGGNIIGVAGDANFAFNAANTKTGAAAHPLDPMLLPLAANGGPSIGYQTVNPVVLATALGTGTVSQSLLTEALAAGSPAVGQADLFRAPAYDARGMLNESMGRVNSGACALVSQAAPAPNMLKTNALISQQMVNGVLTTFLKVNDTDDTHNPPAGFLTLRAAIDYASMIQGNKVIEFILPGTYRITLPGPDDDANVSGDFDIVPNFGNVSIVNATSGAVVVDGNHLDRVFDINPGDDTKAADKFKVTFDGFTITGGLASTGDGAAGSGGGIRAQGIASVQLENMAIVNNLATADGGGISMENGASAPWTLIVNNSLIAYNHAGDAGGGIETDGTGKVLLNVNTGAGIDDVIIGNTTVNQGGGIWLDAINPGTVVTATVVNPGQNAFVSQPTVTFTSADGHGSGAQGTAVLDAKGKLIGITITSPGSGYDTAPLVTVTGGEPAGAGDNPGVMVTATLSNPGSADLTVIRSNINNNVALTMLGGGIGNSGTGSVSISASSVQNNFSGGAGGGIGDSGNLGTLAVNAVLFSRNFALGGGGAIQEGGPNTVLTNDQFTANTTGATGGALLATGTALSIQADGFAGNIAAGNGTNQGGGAIEMQVAAAVTIGGSTFTGNYAINNAEANGGALDAEGAQGSLVLQNDTFASNGAANGGAVYAPATMTSLLFTNNFLQGNFATTSGGAVFSDAVSTGIGSSYFAWNAAAGTGGALFAAGTNLMVQNSTFASNQSGMDAATREGGGAIELQTTATASFTSATFAGNHTAGSGGAIDAQALVGTLKLLNDTVDNNAAATGGGINWGGLSGSSVSLKNTILALDTAFSGADAFDPTGTMFTDLGGNLIGIAGDANFGFGAGSHGSGMTQTGTAQHPLNPLLNPLANNGGPSVGAPGANTTLPTQSLRAGGPAIGKGIAAGAPGNDARGVKNAGAVNVGASNQVA